MNKELINEVREWHKYLESFDPYGESSCFAKFGGLAAYGATVETVRDRVKKLYELIETE